MFHVVLIEPEIPQNTGNISRTCAVTGSVLHIVKPMAFSIDERQVKRAGLDYWDELDLRVYENTDDFLRKNAGARFHLSTTKAQKSYAQARYSDGDYLIFGKETRGLPESLLRQYESQCIRIPMRDTMRSLNLSNAVAVVLYEALRQNGFPSLAETGTFPAEQCLYRKKAHICIIYSERCKMSVCKVLNISEFDDCGGFYYAL